MIVEDIDIFAEILSIILIIGSIALMAGGWTETVNRSDPGTGFVCTIIALLFGGLFAGLIPTDTYTEFQNIEKYDVLVTERFVKVFEKTSQKEIVSTTDHFTITNISKYNMIKHVWSQNIYGGHAAPMDQYSLVEKQQIEAEKK